MSNYKHHRFQIIRKQYGGKKITDVTDVTIVTNLFKKSNGMIMVGCPKVHISKHSSRSLPRRRHIQAFAQKTRADSQDHGWWTAVHMSIHSHTKFVETLKITVGCPTCTRACTPGAPACRDERPKSCAWAKRPTDQKKRRGNFTLQEYFGRRNYFTLQI